MLEHVLTLGSGRAGELYELRRLNISLRGSLANSFEVAKLRARLCTVG